MTGVQTCALPILGHPKVDEHPDDADPLGADAKAPSVHAQELLADDVARRERDPGNHAEGRGDCPDPLGEDPEQQH